MPIRCLIIDNEEMLEGLKELFPVKELEDFRRDYFFIQGRGKGKFVRVQRDDIFYLESAGNYTKIHLKDGLQITHSSLKEMEVLLCADEFIRVHRSYVLNMNKVIAVDGNTIQLCNGSAVMLGSNYQKAFFDYIFPESSKFRR